MDTYKVETITENDTKELIYLNGSYYYISSNKLYQLQYFSETNSYHETPVKLFQEKEDGFAIITFTDAVVYNNPCIVMLVNTTTTPIGYVIYPMGQGSHSTFKFELNPEIGDIQDIQYINNTILIKSHKKSTNTLTHWELRLEIQTHNGATHTTQSKTATIQLHPIKNGDTIHMRECTLYGDTGIVNASISDIKGTVFRKYKKITGGNGTGIVFHASSQACDGTLRIQFKDAMLSRIETSYKESL